MPVAGSFQANDALALRRAAVEGMGIAMLPRFAAAGGRRRRQPFDCLRLRLDIYSTLAAALRITLATSSGWETWGE